MRAEERHKLHRNELSDLLGKWNERIKPYSNVIFIAVLAVAVGVAAFAYWGQQSQTEQTLAWEGYYRGVSTENTSELESVAAQYPGTKVGQCAALSVADIYLAKGCQGLFQNKSVAGEDLREAVKHYRVVQDESRDPMLLQQALYGLGRAYEALAGTRQSQGELQKAVETYRQLVDGWPNGPYAEQAARRLEDLERYDTKAFYDRFAQFDPQPARPPISGLPGDPVRFDMESLSEDSPLPGPAGMPRPDWTEEPESSAAEDDSSRPGEAPSTSSGAPETTPPPEEAGPELPPAEGAGPSVPPSPEEAPEPAAAPPSEPAPSEESSDPPPAPAPGASNPGPSPTTEPSEASP